VIDGTGQPLSDATLTVSGSSQRTLKTDASGHYSIKGLIFHGNYTVSPANAPNTNQYTYNPPSQTVNNLQSDIWREFTAIRLYTLSGRVTDANNVGIGNVTLTLSGTRTGTTLTLPDGSYQFPDIPEGGSYTLIPSKANYTFSPPNRVFSNLSGNQRADFNGSPNTIQFSAATYAVAEGAGSININITRSGDLGGPASVDYSTADDTAKQRTDYTISSGTLSFTPGESVKTFSVLVTDNAFVDGTRTVNLTLGNLVGAIKGNPAAAVLNILDNDTVQPSSNPIDESQLFVRQQYADFLNRTPDDGGLAYWSNEINRCGSDALCIQERRVGVADAFFFEAEFQQTGAYIYRIYRASLGPKPPSAQFISDRGRVVAGAGLDRSKTAFALNFVQRASFVQEYPLTQTADQFVNTMLTVVKNYCGVDLSSQRSALLALYDGTDNGRAAILRQVVDSPALLDAEYNQSFVLMEYFGYLRRDPDAGGFDFWLAQVNKFALRDVGIQHAMACSFITSAEYQTRFSPVVTHTNLECPQ
jgi:hypothetical protein